MKLSTLSKISLSALAITVSMPMKGEAMNGIARARQARLAAEQAAQVQAQQQAQVQQQALAQQQALEAQRQQEEQRRRDELARQQEEQRRRAEEEQRLQREAQQVLARQEEQQRLQREAQQASIARQQREALEAQQALARQEEEERQRNLQVRAQQALAGQEAIRQERERQAQDPQFLILQRNIQEQALKAVARQKEEQQQREAQQALAQQQPQKTLTAQERIAKMQAEQQARNAAFLKNLEEKQAKEKEGKDAKVQQQAPVEAPVVRKQKFQEALNTKAREFPELSSVLANNLNRIAAFYADNPNAGSDPLVFAQKINQRLKDEKRNVDNPNQRIIHVARALEFMKALFPDLKEADVRDQYTTAVEQRDRVYNYMVTKGKDFSSEQDFIETVTSLKGKLKTELNDVFKSGLSFDTALAIKAFEDGMDLDKDNTRKYFEEKLGAMRIKIDPLLNLDFYHFDCADKTYNLTKDWDSVVDEIKRITRNREGNPLKLNYEKLTYEDHFSAFFDREYAVISNEDGIALENRLLNLIRTHMEDDSANLVQPEDELTYGQDSDHRIYFQDDATVGEITGQRNGLYSIPANADATRVYYIGKIKEYFTTLNRTNDFNQNDGDKGFFRARAKVLLDLASPCLIPPNVARREEVNFDQQKWDEALGTAEYTMGVRIVCSLEGCDTGKDRKMGAIEADYRDVLGVLHAQIPLIKAVASVVRGIKLRRIAETGLNPSGYRHEERETTPQVLTQRTRAPFGLLGDFMPVTAPFYGYPGASQNAPVQLTKNMFEEGQPARSYHTGPTPKANQPETTLPVHVPLEPCLNVKRLVEETYKEFGGLIKGNDLHQFLKGNLDLVQEQLNVDMNDKKGIFYKALPRHVHTPEPQDQFTREMAFYVLEKTGYIVIDPNMKDDLFKLDEKNNPGTTKWKGRDVTLKEFIDEF